jgi:cystathionine beta-lyase
MKYGTRLLHTGVEIDPATGASSVPIYQASTFHHESLEHPPRFDYARSGNPTRQALEDALTVLEGGVRGFAFSSGMAAMTTTLLLFGQGDHIVACEDIYGGTYRALTRIFTRLGIETTFVDTTDLDKVEAAIRPNTKALLLETPSNPVLKITDLRAAVEIAKRNRLLTIVDNTFMSPYLQRPLELGIDIVVHSGTKFIGGHSDVVAGIVVVNEKKLGSEIKFLQNSFGSILGPQDAWLLLRGIKTLKVRMDASQASAMKIAQWLATNPRVEKVYYPGLEAHPGREIHVAQSDGPGAVLSFDLGSEERARHVLESVRLPLVAVSLGGVESILSYPAMMSHAAMPEQEREALGITKGLLRLSVGLEDPDDLIEDLDQALRSMERG